MTQPAAPAPASLEMPAWLLSPEHAARMGGALWVFLWLWREGVAGESPHVREVRGGGVVRLEEISQALGLSRRSVERHLATLREAGYLQTWRERHGFTALVSLWEAGNPAPPEMAGQDVFSPAKNGGTERETAPVPPDMAVHRPSPAKYGGTDNPSGLPLRVLEESFLGSCSSQGSCNVSTTAKTAQVVPFPGAREAGAPRPAAAVAAGKSPGRLRQEQAITHYLSRIEAWERPDLTRTLLEALCAVPISHLEAVFDQAWRFHRHRDKALNSPAAWWASTLCRCADACMKALKGASDYG